MPFIFDVKVVPRSGKKGFKLDKQGRLKCYLKSAPERGQANKELIKLIAKALGITQAETEIVAGATSRTKKIKISRDLTFAQLLAELGIEQQMGLFE